MIIAHVDHGKTTLVDCLLRQSGQFRDSQLRGERILDSNDLERERGITILSKNIALPYQGVKINVIDTPGHADFGGEVERVVRMADGALLLVDAAEGPMPQTRFVLSKALECGLRPIVVVNKIDRPDARSVEVLDEAFELLMELGADEHLEDIPYVFASAKDGIASTDPDQPGESMRPLLDLVLSHVPGPDVDANAPLQMLVTTLDWSEYVGRIAVGRIQSGTMSSGQAIDLCQADDQITPGKLSGLHVFENLGRVEVESAEAGEVVAVVGLDDVEIGDTICARELARPLPRLTVDEPTLEMVFSINSSPFAGREGKYVTTRQLRERLFKELERNVALRVRPLDDADSFAVAGRGVLHLAVLVETMRRESYELSVGKPRVILKSVGGVTQEPFETLHVEVPTDRLGPVMEMIGQRCGIVRTDELPRRVHARAVPNPGAGADRVANPFAQRDAGHGDDSSPIRRLPGPRRRCAAEAERSHDFHGHRQGGWLRSGRIAGTSGTLRGAGRRSLRGHDRRRKQPRKRPGRQPDQGKEADQHPGGRQRCQYHAQTAARAQSRSRPGIHRRR